MRFNRTDRNVLQFDDVEIPFKNFSGRASDYNAEGNRNFTIRITKDIWEELKEEGWSGLSIYTNKDGDELYLMKIKLGYKFDNGPMVRVKAGKIKKTFDEGRIRELDNIYLISGSMDIKPSYWQRGKDKGISPWLKSAEFIMEVDRFDEEAMEEGIDILPFEE